MAAAVALAFTGVPAVARAATIQVNSSADLAEGGGVCTLREAVIAANTGKAPNESDCTPGASGSNTIELPGATYDLTLEPVSELSITAPLTIRAEGATPAVIEQTKEYRIFDVESTGVLISGVTMLKGDAVSGDGAGVLVGPHDALTLTDSQLEKAHASESGGGVYVGEDGAITIEGSTIAQDDAEGEGGGVSLAEAAGATIVNSSISDDFGKDGGGGIDLEKEAHATIDESEVLGDNVGVASGGGILADGPLTLQNTNVDGNESFIGGGIDSINGAPLTLNGGAVSDNTAVEEGGGIVAGPLTATATTISGNSATEMNGGGLTLFGESTLTDVTVSGNSADTSGGGIFAAGPLTLTNSWVHGNDATSTTFSSAGGGVFYQAQADGEPLKVVGSTIGPENNAALGAGLYLNGEFAETAHVTRSTIAQNGLVHSGYLKFERGGGIYVGTDISAALHDVTVAMNSSTAGSGAGGNLYVFESGVPASQSKLTWENSLIANSQGGGSCSVPPASTTSLGGDEEYDVKSGDFNSTRCGFDGPSDTVSGALETSQLHALANNGGPTETMALAPGAPPVGTGFGCEATDQRGVRRPTGSCDAGAYQVDPPAPLVTITSGPSGTVYERSVSFTFTSSGAEEPTTLQCSLDGGPFVLCVSPFNAGPLALGTHTFTVKALDSADLLSGEASRTFTVAAGSAPGVGLGKAAAIAPVISGLTQSHARWREGSAPARISRAAKKPPRGTTFSFTLNEAATVHLVFTQPASGRRLGGRCVAQTKHNRSKRACRRAVTVGTITLMHGSAGADHVRFEGRLSAAKKLKPGRYTLVLSASVGALSSASRSLAFTIVG